MVFFTLYPHCGGREAFAHTPSPILHRPAVKSNAEWREELLSFAYSELNTSCRTLFPSVHYSNVTTPCTSTWVSDVELYPVGGRDPHIRAALSSSTELACLPTLLHVFIISFGIHWTSACLKPFIVGLLHFWEGGQSIKVQSGWSRRCWADKVSFSTLPNSRRSISVITVSCSYFYLVLRFYC